MQLTNTEHTFSFYNNLMSANAPDNEFDVNQLIEVIRYGYIKKDIKALRSLKDKKERSYLKRTKLPCVTLSGTFTKRNKEHLEEHSGLIQIDIDDLEEYDAVFKTLTSDPYTFVAFKSPSGNGLKLIIKINPDVGTHLEQFLALQKYYLDEYSIEIDGACKDIARCMLLSYDPNIYCNPFSEIYPELIVPEVELVSEKTYNINYKINVHTNDDLDIIENLTSEIERNNIDITDGYLNWIRIGFSLATTLGENGRAYFDRLSRFNGGYRPRECDKQYTSLLSRNNGSITLGTLIYIARINGIEVVFPSQKTQPQSHPTQPNFEMGKTALYEILKRKRWELANNTGRPAYTIFTNKTIDDLVDKMPKTQEEFLNIYGISQKRCDAYAKDFLPIIINYNASDTISEKPMVQKSILPKLNRQDETLFQELRTFRLNHALDNGLKAFHVFGNTTLYEIVEVKPKNKEELLDVKGIGERKLEQVGDAVLEIVIKHAS